MTFTISKLTLIILIIGLQKTDMSGINNTNYVSQVPSTFGPANKAGNTYSGTTATSPNPFQSGDKYSVDNTSNSFDQAMAKLTGKNVFSAQSTNTQPTTQPDGTKNLPANVTQEEMNWALLLEQKVSEGYKPNEQETQAYQGIAAKLSGSATNPTSQTQQTMNTSSLPAGVSQDEINWAMALEQKVKGGYTPNAQETQAYQNIATKLQAGKSAQTTTTAPTQQAGASQEEINWALALEQKVKGGYTPNAQETQAYQNIATKLSAAKTPQTTATAPTQSSLPAGVSQDEINWAMALEQKVKGGYTPNDQETQAYQGIANKLSAAKTASTTTTAPTQQTAQTGGLPAGVSQEEINWAMALEQKVKGGYAPNAQETQTYQGIAAKLAAGNTPTTPPQQVSQDEVNWALALEQKVKGGYTPNAQETSTYQDIAHRLQTQSAQPNNTGAANNKDWATWSQPFTVPRNLFQTTPQIIQVPASLRSAVPTLPSYTAVNAGPSLNTASGTQPAANQPVSKSEVDWALSIEQKVKSGYNPTNAELYQYKNIAERLQATHGAGVTTPAANTATTTQPATTAPGTKTSIGQRMSNAWNALTK